MVRVKPEDPPGNAVYLVKTIKQDYFPLDRLPVNLSDSFWAGKGRYAVDLAASDDLGRICRKEWRLNANPALNISLGAGSGGHLAMLARMINAEIQGAPPSDAVIFFGRQERFRDAIPEEDLLPRSGHPQFFYLRPGPLYTTTSSPDPNVWDGSIAKAITSVGGKTIDFGVDFSQTPVDLPHSIARIRRLVLAQSN